MSEHDWVQEHITAAVTGGLDAAENERLDNHLSECVACGLALSKARDLDRDLGALFADVRPASSLDERTILALRNSEVRRLVQTRWKLKLAVGIAASVLVGTTGAIVRNVADFESLPMPGSLSFHENLKTVNSDDVHRLGAPAGLEDSPHAVNAPHEGFVTKFLANPELAQREARIALGDLSELEARRNHYFYSDLGRQAPVDSERFIANGGKEPTSALGFGGGNGISGGIGGNVGGGPVRPDDGANLSTNGPAQRQAGQGGALFYGGYSQVNEPKLTAGIDAIRTPENNSQKPGQSPPNLGFGYVKPDAMKPRVPTSAKEYFQVNQLATDFGINKDTSGRDGKKTDADVAYIPIDSTVLAITKNPPIQEPAAQPRKIIIRTGDLEFEVESFDVAVATVTKLVNSINGAFVATVNSEKLPNGKMKGAIVLRVPPEHLDALVLDLRKDLGKAGELKRQKIGSQDISKQYTDLESRLKAAETMEQRLLQMIKDGKGEIKQLLDAEKELGVWRTRIEEYKGELKYYGNLVALSTLTITMAEREIRTAAVVTESERVQAGLEAEDVDAARQQALAAIAEAKGRVTKSELKQLAAGQFNATLNFEVAPDAAGPLRDRLRQIGRMARLEIDRVQHAEGGTVPRDAKIVRGDAQFLVQIYNLANVAPRETATLQVAVADVPASYQALREAITKANGRVLTAKLEEQDKQNVSGQLDFEVRRADEPAMKAVIAAAGEVVARNVSRAVDGDNVTDSKVLFRTSLVSAAQLKPRETTLLAIEVTDVDNTVSVYGAQVKEVGGRVVDAQVAHERGGRVTARVIYDVPLAAAPALVAKFNAAGVTRMQKSTRDPQATDGKFAMARIDVTLANADLIVPKDDGVMPQVRRGLTYSVSMLLMSVTWLVFGLCVLLPWAVIGYGGYRVFRRVFRSEGAAAVARSSSTEG